MAILDLASWQVIDNIVEEVFYDLGFDGGWAVTRGQGENAPESAGGDIQASSAAGRPAAQAESDSATFFL